MSEKIIKRGEIYWADLTDEEEESKKRKDQVGKIRKSEAQKDRPVVVISNDKQNKYSEDVIVALVTSRLDKIYYFEPEISLKKKSKILTDQILTIEKSRLGKRIASLKLTELIKLEKALHAVLSLRIWCRKGHGILTLETWQLLQLLAQQEEIAASQVLEKALKEYSQQKKQKSK